MVSPGPLSIEPKKSRRFPHHRLAHQPVDLREGVAKAYSVVKEVGGPPVLPGRHPRGGQWVSFIHRGPGSGLGLLPAAGARVCVG